MIIVGAEQTKFHGPEDELTHLETSEPLWQESVVLLWWDLRTGCGGVHRLGHEPNWNGGEATVWSTLWTPAWVYKNVKGNVPLRAEVERASNLMIGDGGALRYDYKDHCRWTVADVDASASLGVEDYHMPLDPFPKVGDMSKDMASGHTEVSGRVSGRVTIKGTTIQITDGFAIRDHSWGVRNWNMLLAHRWLAGNLGPNFTFCVISYLDANQKLSRFGYLIREGRLHYSKSVDIVTFMESDSLTHRGGLITLNLADDERVDILCEPLAKGQYSWTHGIAAVDTPCLATCGKYRGFCDYEITGNMMNGRDRPMNSLNAYRDNGIHANEVPARLILPSIDRRSSRISS
jgi:hypothetical protein